jgi:hypothetical protein
MTQAVLNTQLYQKMFAEQEQFKEELMQLPQEEIMDGEIHVAEYTSPMLWLPCWFRTVRAYLNLPP